MYMGKRKKGKGGTEGKAGEEEATYHSDITYERVALGVESRSSLRWTGRTSRHG